MPAKLAAVLGLTDTVRAIPIVEPKVTHSIGLVVPHRNPLTPLINALVSEAKQLAPILSSDRVSLRDIGNHNPKRRTSTPRKDRRSATRQQPAETNLSK
jgi:hypothetical protein